MGAPEPYMFISRKTGECRMRFATPSRNAQQQPLVLAADHRVFASARTIAKFDAEC